MTTYNNIPTFHNPQPDNLFLASSYGLHSYGDLEQFTTFFLQFLYDFEHNFEKPVGFLASSTDTFIFAIAACWKLGIPFVIFDHKAPVSQIHARIDKLNPGLIFTDQKYQSLLNFEDQIDITQLDLSRSLKVDIKLADAARHFEANDDPDAVFGFFFTSGTSGEPKVVPLKRRQMLFAAQASAENIQPRVNHFWLLCLPLNHVGGISIILRSLLYGSAIFRMNSFHPEIITTFLSENKLFQAASLVPTMLRRLMDIPSFHIHKEFKAFLLGGGPIDPQLVKECNHKGVPLIPSYGMTETCAQIAANPILKPSGIYGPLTSTGRIFPPNKIQIRDNQGEPLGVNNSGTIWFKGPQVFDGYWDESKGAFDEKGWFRTGDVGHLNVHGHLFIESRESDLIITGGENVSPYEVESALERLPSILEAAVIGMPDDQWGEKVVAVVVGKTQQQLDTEQVRETLKQSLTSYKIPKQILQIDSLPKTKTGKIKRKELNKKFLL